MADNVVLNAGTGGDTVAADDVGGVKYQVVKVAVGADGAASLVSNSNPVPVSDAGGALTVDGTVAATQSGTWNVGTVTTVTTVSAVTAISNALPAGTNNIGDVDVLSVVPGTGATALGKAVDSAAGATDTGVALLAVRDDALTTLTPADGDYVPLRTDSTGALHVRISGGGVSGIVDDAAFTPGTTELVPVGFHADETSADSVNEGDLGAARMSLDRKIYTIAHHETSTIYQNGTARTPGFAIIDAATSGDNTLLAAQGAGNKIRVHQLFLVAAGTTTVRFESGAGGTALTGQMNLVANTGFSLPYSPVGWFETAANALLNLELSAAVSVDGCFTYTVVT